MQRVFQAAAANPLMIPPDLMSYFVDYVQTSRLIIPIGQVFGASGFRPVIADPVNAEDTSSSDTFEDIANVGPQINGLADGSYLVLYRADTFNNTSGGGAAISPSFNGSTPTTNDSAFNVSLNEITTFGFTTATLNAGGSNTIKLQYRRVNAAGTAIFERRQLAAIKFANL